MSNNTGISAASTALRKHWPLLLIVLLFVVRFADIYDQSTTRNDGNFVYAVDDAYIHMSIAKNFVTHGVWGVTEYEFTSNSSSPLWTLLLSGTYALFGINEIAPLLLNAIAMVGLIAAVYITLRNHQVPTYFIGLLVVLMYVLFPLVPYAFLGMEHVLHAFLTVVCMAWGVELIARKETSHWRSRDALIFYALAALVVGARFEGLFLVASLCGLLLLRRRMILAILAGIAAWVPVVLHGVFALANGWPFLPVSIQLKSSDSMDSINIIDSTGDMLAWITGFITRLPSDAILLVTIITALILISIAYLNQRKVEHLPIPAFLFQPHIVFALVMIASMIFHHRFLDSQSPYDRYFFYIVTMILVAMGILGGHQLPQVWRKIKPRTLGVTLTALIAVCFPIMDRAYYLETRSSIVQASNNIYGQQVQMARFLQTHYNDEIVVANDIGAITYFADIHLVDIIGLGTVEVAQARLNDAYSHDVMAYIVDEAGAEIGIVYTDWIIGDLTGTVPESWIAVATWKSPSNIILGDDTVTFYALNESAIEPLAAALRDFSGNLPQYVQQQHFIAAGGG